MSIRDKFDNPQKSRPDIVSEYKNYKSKIQASSDEFVLHKPDKVDILTSNLIAGETTRDDDYPGSSGTILTGRTFLLKDSHVDNNPATDDVITVEHVSYGGQYDTETHNKVEYTETRDGDKQVIVERTGNNKMSSFTEVDSNTGLVIDEWTKNS